MIQSRRLDGKPETPRDKRFLDLRDSGYAGPIDQDGYAAPDHPDAETGDMLRGR